MFTLVLRLEPCHGVLEVLQLSLEVHLHCRSGVLPSAWGKKSMFDYDDLLPYVSTDHWPNTHRIRQWHVTLTVTGKSYFGSIYYKKKVIGVYKRHLK